jgi:hypothetical protein
LPASRIIGRRLLERARPSVEQRLLAPLGIAFETVRAVRTRIEISLVRQRVTVTRRFPQAARDGLVPRVLVVVTHVGDPVRDSESGVARLAHTLDAVLESLDHAHVDLVLNTLPDRHVASDLPPHLHTRLEIREQAGVEPLFVGFEAQNEFARRLDDADWFLYLEDDLLLRDSLFIEKLAFFNAAAPRNALLVPHRYELWRGSKVYIDLCSKQAPGENRTTNALTRIEIGDWKFAEFENPHSGVYCLSRPQLSEWLESGRHWYGLASYAGPRESAATGSLEEVFRLYKPHPDNMNFLEVRHLGTKYAELYARVAQPEA